LKISLSRLSILWQIFSNGTNQIKSSHNELITAEMLIIKAIYSCNIPDIENLLDKSSQIAEFNVEQTAPSTNPKTEINRNIFDFLKFCHGQNEMELYYVLLNEVEVKNFTEPLIEIAANSKISQEKNLKSMLHKWSGIEWNIVICKQDKINSLKQELLKKAKASEDFTVIKNNFPNADVSDIILKS
jgi:DNA polymerase-3 subunit gamma/tau